MLRGCLALCRSICTLISPFFQSSCWLAASGRDGRTTMLLILSKHLRGMSVSQVIPRLLSTPHLKDGFGGLLLKLWISVSLTSAERRRGDIARKVAPPAQDRRALMLTKEAREVQAAVEWSSLFLGLSCNSCVHVQIKLSLKRKRKEGE